MKKKVIYSIVLLFLTVAFISKVPTAVENSVSNTHLQPGSAIPDNEFLLGAVHNAHDQENNYGNMKDYFHLNTWHKYTKPTGWGWYFPGTDDVDTNDYWNNTPSSFQYTVTGSIGNNNAESLRTVMDRPVIQYFAYGQKSDYQCEDSIHIDPDLWFYGYKIHSNINMGDYRDTSMHGSGQWVRHCSFDPQNPGSGAAYVVSELKANREQANKRQNPWTCDSMYSWYIKPRIRIDSSFVDTNPNDTICRIEIINWHGQEVKSVGLIGEYFKDGLGNYDGRYLMEFDFESSSDTELVVNPGWLLCPYPDSGRKYHDWNVPIKTDFKVYWYGTCEMWIDYVRVENQPSVDLHSGSPTYINMINREVDWALTGYNANRPNNFYMEEFEFNTTSCIKRVNEIIEDHSVNKLSLMVNLQYGIYKLHIPNCWSRTLDRYFIKRFLIDSAKIKYIVTNSYALEGWTNEQWPEHKSYHPNTFNVDGYDSANQVFSYSTSPDAYDTWLQNKLDTGKGFLAYNFIMKFGDSLAKISDDLRIISLQQAHLWCATGHMLKEPTNEEAEMMSNLAISYGAKGILYFSYNSHYTPSNGSYSFGLTKLNYSLRDTSVYKQNKAQGYSEMNQKYVKWGPYLLSFDDDSRESYIFRFTNEREVLLQNTYFLNIKTFKPGSGYPSCNAPDDTTGDYPPPQEGLIIECPEVTYLQTALFNNPGDNYQYFMLINRRCSPVTASDTNGGKRFVRILFDANDSISFPNYDNWDIIDLEKDSTILTFDKTKVENLDLGWYMPGEGKLYKIAPLVETGGTLVTNEVINQDVNCGGIIYNDGYDITISPNTTLEFSEGAGLEMSGGSFFCGSDAGDPINVTFKGLNGSRWNGITLDECDTVGIYSAKFEDVKQNKTGGGNNFALNLIDCYNFKVANNLIECNQDSAFGGINSVYINEPDCDTLISYISENTFNMSNSPSPSVEIISSAGITTPLLLQWNIFNTTCDSSIAIIINNVVGGAIKNNTINSFSKGINLLSSSLDIYGNTIFASSFNDAIAILAVSGSTLNMGPNSAYLLGGSNCFSNTGTGTRNINVVNSYFDVDEGENYFNISDNDPQTAYHFYGYFPEELENGDEYATINCFQIDSAQDEANHDVTWGEEGDNVNFIFDDNCGGGGGGQSGGLSSSGSNNYVVFYIGNGITDTIFLRTFGNSTLYDSLCTDTRKRDYNSVISKCTELLNNYPDSSENLDAIAKLYAASLSLDSSGSKIQPLKSYLETLILNNAGNTSLISRAFYFIQKCKAALKLYQSALQGFQQIINQNPYSYEGLVASWDYAATYLLDSLGGSGGGEKGIFFDDDPDDRKSTNDDKDPYDRQKFTKEDRKVITTNVLTAFEEKSKQQVEKVKNLEKKTRSDDKVTRTNAEKELKKIRVLKEVVKEKRPKNKIEYVKILNKDILRVFGGGHKSDNLRGDNLIPTEFNLYQNYPNPFNPTTKIKYDLPKQGKVKLIIYDILGREIIKLVNNEFMPAGRYTKEFTGHNLASGVYFYRLLVDDGKEYIKTKKMVFIK